MDKYKLCIKGKNPDYFLRKIIDKKINIYEIEKGFKKLCIVVDDDGYKVIKKTKTSYDIELLSVSGFLKIKEVFHKYFFFILFFVMGIFLNIFLSNIIFDVEVVHSNKEVREIIYNDLEKLGISKFKFKVSFSKKEKIIKEILNKEKEDIEWLEIEEIGTKYLVKVEQRKLNDNNDICNNRDIVAKKNAIILEIFAESGEVIKKKNDYVLKDEVIISGVIHNKEDVVSNKCSVGKVFGEVWYKVDVSLPTKYSESNKTGKSNYKFRYKFLDKEYLLFNKFDNYKEENIFEFSNKLLPISFGFSKYYEVIKKDIIYTIDNCDEEALKIALEKLLLKLGKEDVILTKKVLKKEVKNSKILVEVFFKVKEDITSYRDIVIDEAKEEGD